MDRGFADVQRTFAGHGTTPELLANLLTLAFLLGAAIVLGCLFSRWIAKRRVDPFASTWITGRENIQGLLDLALGQRVRFDLLLINKKGRRRFIACALVSCGPDGATLELSEVVHLPQECLGQTVDIFFRLTTEEPELPAFLSFKAEITGLATSDHDSTLFTVDLPDRMELRQKRSRLRISPPFKLVKRLALWPEHLDEEGALSVNPKDWGKPLLYLDPKNLRAVRILDISGGGMRIECQQAAASSANLDLSRPERLLGGNFFIDLRLHDPRTSSLLHLLLHAKVKSATVNNAKQLLVMGLSFTAEAGNNPDLPGMVVWRHLQGDASVEGIDNWVFKRHLDLHREKGVA